jgi:hypothetical protein
MADIQNDNNNNIDYNDFMNFVKNINDSSISINCDYFASIKNLYDGYNTFLVSRKYDSKYIKDMREKAIINNYILYKSLDSKNIKNISEYYKKNIIDNFDKKLNPPPCIFTEASRERRIEAENNLKDEVNCDISTHYKNINSKYEYYNNLDKQNENIELEYLEADICDDEYFEEPYYYSTDEEEYYEDYISDYESDYLSDDY